MPPTSEHYSRALRKAVRANLRTYPAELLALMLPGLLRRGGDGLRLLQKELARRRT